MKHAAKDGNLAAAIKRQGYTFVDAARLRATLERYGSLADWNAFAASWNDMPLDGYMADGGRYRRRRHAVFAIEAGGRLLRQPHQAHYQSREYNSLNGGTPRWFEPISPAIGAGSSLTTILRFSAAVFTLAASDARGWRAEIHQFRIESRDGEHGLPTPEGVHRDGVDYVLVLLVARHNIAQGMTDIFAPDGAALGHFTLVEPFDAVLLDDQRVYHGVTAVAPLDSRQAAYRDVLVVTFQRDR